MLVDAMPAVAPLPELEIFGAIDGFRLSGPINGWAVLRRDGDYMTGLHVELRRGEAVLSRVAVAGPRSDVTQDEMVDAAFSLDFSAVATVEDMLDGVVVAVAVDDEGRFQPLGIFEPVLLKVVEEHALDAQRQADARAAATALEALARNSRRRRPPRRGMKRRRILRRPCAEPRQPARGSCLSMPAARCSPATRSATS